MFAISGNIALNDLTDHQDIFYEGHVVQIKNGVENHLHGESLFFELCASQAIHFVSISVDRKFLVSGFFLQQFIVII